MGKRSNGKTNNRLILDIYTDGSCIKDGCGGWGFVSVSEDPKYCMCRGGGANNTTNSRMELTAAKEAISYATRPSIINIYSDSKYVVKGIKSLKYWKEAGWKTKDKKPLANQDLWSAIDKLIIDGDHMVIPHWVKGHNGNVFNELADQIAGDHSNIMARKLSNIDYEKVRKDRRELDADITSDDTRPSKYKPRKKY